MEQILKLIALPNTRRQQVKHSDYAGPASKPTGIFAHRLFTLEQRLLQFKFPVKPRTALKGRDLLTGEWRTAVSKEYPPPLSHALALTMVDEATAAPILHNIPLPGGFLEDLQQYMPVLDHYEEVNMEFGADYVDNAMLPIDRFKMPIRAQDFADPIKQYCVRGDALPLYVNENEPHKDILWP